MNTIEKSSNFAIRYFQESKHIFKEKTLLYEKTNTSECTFHINSYGHIIFTASPNKFTVNGVE